jgi:hypothetical protein
MKLTKVQHRLAKAMEWYGWIEDIGGRSLKAMERRGLVTSTPCPNSAVRLEWRLTTAGRAALAKEPSNG